MKGAQFRERSYPHESEDTDDSSQYGPGNGHDMGKYLLYRPFVGRIHQLPLDYPNEGPLVRILVLFLLASTGWTNSPVAEELNVMMLARLEHSLRWRQNGRNSVSNHQPHDCLFNRLFRRRSRKTSKLRVTGLCVGNSPGPVNSPHKGPVTRKMLPFDDVIMYLMRILYSTLLYTGDTPYVANPWGWHMEYFLQPYNQICILNLSDRLIRRLPCINTCMQD